MTDARDRLAQGLEILMARPYNYWHLKEAAATIAAFVEERIGERDARVSVRLRAVESLDMATAKALDDLMQRLEAVEDAITSGQFTERAAYDAGFQRGMEEANAIYGGARGGGTKSMRGKP